MMFYSMRPDLAGLASRQASESRSEQRRPAGPPGVPVLVVRAVVGLDVRLNGRLESLRRARDGLRSVGGRSRARNAAHRAGEVVPGAVERAHVRAAQVLSVARDVVPGALDARHRGLEVALAGRARTQA